MHAVSDMRKVKSENQLFVADVPEETPVTFALCGNAVQEFFSRFRHDICLFFMRYET